MLAEIVDIHTSSGGTYGSPRIHAMLRRRGISIGRKRVERLMRGAPGCRARSCARSGAWVRIGRIHVPPRPGSGQP
ncbi:IS3 family transposase [Nocardia gamkensis]|uniref:IS3 family transposase n=1 Tax=Nocardia gamkensis TaxID=352869 RepID=UPI0036E75294